MVNGEHEPTNQKTETQQQEVARVGMPVVVFDQTHTVSIQRDEKDLLRIRVFSGETPLFSAAITPDDNIHTTMLKNGKARKPQPEAAHKPEPQPARLDRQEQLPLPITLEGYPTRSASYDGKKRLYGLTIAHHPNPEDRKQVIYYQLKAEGDKADEFYALRITETRTPVHVTGIDRSYEATKSGKTGEKKLIRLIEAETIEKIQGRTDNHVVLREKVSLADADRH